MMDFWIGTSWKMNKPLVKACAFVQGLADAKAGRDPRIQRCVIPPFAACRMVKAVLNDTPARVGARNMHCDSPSWTTRVNGIPSHFGLWRRLAGRNHRRGAGRAGAAGSLSLQRLGQPGQLPRGDGLPACGRAVRHPLGLGGRGNLDIPARCAAIIWKDIA
nr:triose-phosphate isomerase [Paracoccus saliphilus]